MTAPQQKKRKIGGPTMITANRLSDGAVVYRCGNGSWVTQFEHAAVSTENQEANALLADALADELNVIGAYIAPVHIDDGGHSSPGNLRETIRREGPTTGLPAFGEG